MIKKDRETKYFQLTIWYVPRWCTGRAFASYAGDRDSIPGRDKPKS